MAGRVREQRSAEGEGQRRRLSPWIRFIIGVVLILLVTGLLLLWVLNSLGFIQKPWSTLLSNIFTNIYTFIVSVGVLIVGIINANSKEVFQKFFPDSAHKEATSESAKEGASFTTTPVTPVGSWPEDATQPQHNGETISDISRTGGPQRILQLEIVEPAPIVVMPTSSNSIFRFNEHLPDPREFYGRKLECEALINRTRRGASTSIVGPRRVGKTWLIEYLIQVAPTELGPTYRVGYVDATLPGCETVSGFTSYSLEQLGIRVTPSNTSLSLETLLEVLDKLKANNLIPIIVFIIFFTRNKDYWTS